MVRIGVAYGLQRKQTLFVVCFDLDKWKHFRIWYYPDIVQSRGGTPALDLTPPILLRHLLVFK